MAKKQGGAPDPGAPHVHDWRNDETGARDLPIGQTNRPNDPYYRDPGKQHSFTCAVCSVKTTFGRIINTGPIAAMANQTF
jgi:hypothetical protein